MGFASHYVVGHLVRVHDPQRVGPVLAVDRHAEDALVRAQVVRLVGRQRRRELQVGDPVRTYAAPDQLGDVDARRLVRVPRGISGTGR